MKKISTNSFLMKKNCASTFGRGVSVFTDFSGIFIFLIRSGVSMILISSCSSSRVEFKFVFVIGRLTKKLGKNI